MPELPPLPARIARLHKDHRGFPTPWFVQWFYGDKPSDAGSGEPDFRVVDGRKFNAALRMPICWTCGQPLGKHRVFLIGPMCAVNRVISEPPSHRDCAEFSVKACPFLSRPRMRRNEKDLPEKHEEAAGFGIKRNPGVICLWETSDYRPFRPQHGNAGVLFRLGEPSRVDWWAEGRPATRTEVEASIASGFPTLQELARQEGADAMRELQQLRERVTPLLPIAA
jgi:hypothetical protein